MAQEFTTMEFRVGMFLVAVIAAVVSVVVYVGIKKELFADRMTYFVVSTTGENIERGIPVRLSGFKIGNVEKVHLDNIGYIKVELEILTRYHKWFHKDSKIILDQEGIIGNPYFKLIPGTDSSPLLEEGDTLPLSKVAGLSELIQEAEPVIQNLKEIVANIRTITNSFIDKDGHVQSVLANAEEITDVILRNKGLLYYMTQDPRPVQKMDSILARTDHAIKSIDLLVQNATTRVDDLKPIQDELVAIIRDGQDFIKNLQRLQEELGPTLENIEQISSDVRNATTDLVGIRRQGEYTIRLGNELLERFKNTWPFARKEPRNTYTYPSP
ncbi:MlaD family protein [Desulfoplanes sp.]